MRKILSKGKSKSKERFNQLLVGLALIFLMLLSVLGYSLSGRLNNQEETKTINYNGYEFIPKSSYWSLNVQNLEFFFSYSPKEIENISGEVNYIDSYYNMPLYLQSKNSEAKRELYTNLNQVVQRMQNACLNEEDCEENIPIKDCTNNFIIIKEDNVSSIIQEENCVFIQGKEEDLVKITDEFLFKILRIKDNN